MCLKLLFLMIFIFDHIINICIYFNKINEMTSEYQTYFTLEFQEHSIDESDDDSDDE